MDFSDASNVITAYSFLAGLTGGLLTTYRLRRNWRYRYLRKVWGMGSRDSVILVCSERPRPKILQYPQKDEFVYLLKYGDIDALFEVSTTLLRLYPDIDLTVLSSGEADIANLDLASHIVLIGGPDLNLLTRQILDMSQTRFGYRDLKSTTGQDPAAILDRVSGKEWSPDSPDYDYGYFERLQNPMSSRHSIILIGGCHTIGVTGAAKIFSLSQVARPHSAAIVLGNAKKAARGIGRDRRLSILVRAAKIGATVSIPVLADSAVLID